MKESLYLIGGSVVVAILLLVYGIVRFVTPEGQTATQSDRSKTLQATDSVATIQQKILALSSGDSFTYAPGNFSFPVPVGWTQVPTHDVPNPEGFTTPRFSFKKNGTECYLTYYDQEMPATYAQVGFGERTFSGAIQFDSQWYAPKTELPADFKFDFNQKQTFPKEIYSVVTGFTVPTYDHAPFLLLYDGKHGTVDAACVADVPLITTHWAPAFETVQLDETSDGYVFVNRMLGDENQARPYIYFKDLRDGRIKTISESPALWAEPYAVSMDGTLEGLGKDNVLYTVNLFSGTVRHDAPLAVSGHVVSFYRAGDSLWILAAPETDCVDKGECSVSLYEVRHGKIALRAKHEGGAMINGYVPSKKMLVFSKGYGDAGCSSSTVYAYVESTKRVIDIGSEHSCVEEAQTEQQKKDHETIQAVLDQIPASLRGARLRVQRGGVMIDNSDLPRMSGSLFVEQLLKI